MKVLDLFSGIGGFSLGLERAGFETVAFCEIDPFCRKVLAKHWPDIPIHDDIRTLDGKQYRGTVELVCGGFPCQPFSVAGKQSGTGDDRDLWPEMFRVVREVQPTWVIGENVAGFVNMELDRTISDLESSGYACQPFEIPACAIDAKHERKRVWIIANSKRTGIRSYARTQRTAKAERQKLQQKNREPLPNDSNQACATLAHPNTERKSQSEGPEQKLGRWAGNGSEDVSNASSIGIQRQRAGREQEPQAHARSRLSLRDSERPERAIWEIEPGICRVVDGVSNRVDRIKSLGNSVVPQIPELLGRAILQSTNPLTPL